MKRLKIVTVCGCGLGSSLIAKMSIDDILSKEGISASIETADGTSAKSIKCDFYVTTRQFAEKLQGCGTPVVVVTNFVDKQEISGKIMGVINQLKQ